MDEDSNWTPLMRLCFDAGRNDEARAVACAELLLAAGANVDAADDDGDTALAFAAGGNIPRVVQLLLDVGANPNAVGGGGWTPLHWAAWGIGEGCVKNVAILIKHGAAVNAETRHVNADSHETPLVFALERGRYRMYPILLSAGAVLPTATRGDAYLERVCTRPRVREMRQAESRRAACPL